MAGAAGVSRRDAFDAIVAALQEAAFDDDRWPAAAGLLDEACGIKGNALVYGSGASPDDSVVYLARLYFRGQRSEEIERRYFEDYYRQDERLPRLRALPAGRLAHVRDLYTEDERKTSAAYNEFLPLSDTTDCLTARLDGPNGSRILWAFGDPADGDGWTTGRTAMITRLLPHLRQFVRVRQVLADMNGLQASLATLLDHGATGVIQLNRRGRIVAANDRALDLLRAPDGLSDEGGFLGARGAADNEKLQALLARALPRGGGQGAGGSMVVAGRPSLPRAVLHVTPVGPLRGEVPPWDVAALVLVTDPYRELPVDGALVEEALGLSPAERRVAVLLAEGRSAREIAAATGRSENTIRWHIRQIFEKHGLTRIGQLVPLVRSLAGHAGAGPPAAGPEPAGAGGSDDSDEAGGPARAAEPPAATGDAGREPG